MAKISLKWQSVPIIKIDVKTWNTTIDNLREVYGPQTPPRANCKFRTTWYDTTWWIGSDNILNYLDPTTFELKRVVCADNLNGQHSLDYWKLLQNKIKETYKKPMGEIWGYFDCSLWGLRKCVVPQISWSASKYQNLPLDHVYKADISSAFPYEACKRLPTLIGSHIVFKRPEPDAAFPFVFGSDGSLIFVEEDGTIIDTNSINQSIFRGDLGRITTHHLEVALSNHYPKLPFNRPFWLKCPAGPSLEAVMRPLYEAKQQGDATAKQIMNQFIGCCWKRKQPRFLHLAAVILARCDNRIITRAERLIDRGAIPVLIATDSIAWIGKGDELITVSKANKSLGAFVSEMRDGEAIIASPKVYQLRNKDGYITTTWSGVVPEDTKYMPFGAVAFQSEKIYLKDTNSGKWTPTEDPKYSMWW